MGPHEIPGVVVTMNSVVRLKEGASGKQKVYTLVFSGDAEMATNKISVLAPVEQPCSDAELGIRRNGRYR
jgi:transcription elongation GreA/GreB family factor